MDLSISCMLGGVACCKAAVKSVPLIVLVLVTQCFLGCHSFDCITNCWYPAVELSRSTSDPECWLRLPDNPRSFSPHPCDLIIHTNCSAGRKCMLEISVHSFSRQACDMDIYADTATCSAPDQCEYAIIKDIGANGATHVIQSNPNTIKHHPYNPYEKSNSTVIKHTSKKEDHKYDDNVDDSGGRKYGMSGDHVLLSTCYSADTFTSRSAHISFRVIDVTPNKEIDLGPTSVWVLSGLVIFFAVTILVIARCSFLDKWLNPSAQAQEFMPLPKA